MNEELDNLHPMDAQELDQMAEAKKSLEIQVKKIKYWFSVHQSATRRFIDSQKKHPLTAQQAQDLNANVQKKYALYEKWYIHDTTLRTFKRDMLRLGITFSQHLNLLDQKISENSGIKSNLDGIGTKMGDSMKSWPSEEDVTDVVTAKIRRCDDVSQALLEHQKCLTDLQQRIDSWIVEVCSLIDMLSTIKKGYDELLFKIYTIRRQDFTLLRECMYGGLQQTRNISTQSWNLFYEVLRFVPSNKLKLLLAAKPVSDITIVECRDRVQYAYLTIAEVGEILVTEDKWVAIMGRAKDQLKHDICWAFVAAELVSAVRHILDHDTDKVEYSCQDLVDFIDPRKRSVEKTKDDGKHYCYSHGLAEGFEYVRKNGIEREEDRPLEIECRRQVHPRQGLNLGYIGEVVSLDTVNEVLDTLKAHPVAGCIPIFEPDYIKIEDQMYRGPTSPLSHYVTMHAINFAGAGKEENGEKYLNTRSSHGEDFGKDGYFKICMEQLMICLTRGHHMRYFENPFLLTGQYVYPKLLTKEEEEEKKKNEPR